jgi:ribonuclease BN (tRNA processing enzyme)
MLVSQAAVLEQIPAMTEMAYRGLAGRFRYAIEHRVAEAGGCMTVGRASLRFAETQHSAPNLAVRVESGGRVLCYSGDGNFTEASRKLFTDADFLFHEAYSFEEIPIHGEIGAVVKMAEEQNVRRLGLMHVARGVRRKSDRLIDVVHAGEEAVLLPEPGSRYTV